MPKQAPGITPENVYGLHRDLTAKHFDYCSRCHSLSWHSSISQYSATQKNIPEEDITFLKGRVSFIASELEYKG